MIANIKQLYKYRALLWALVVRHLAIRYRGSVLGFFWSLLNPLCLMAVYMLVFRYYIRFSEVHNYTVFLFCGLLPWIWFTSSIIESTSSIVNSGHLITKSLFPAQLLPAVAVLTGLINYLLSLPILFLFMLLTGEKIGLGLAFLPVLMLLQVLFLFGLGLGLCALNVRYRDVQHLVGNLLTLLFFLCPIVYPASVVPEKWHFTLDYNPFALFTQAYQKLLLDGTFPALHVMSYLLIAVLLSLLIGNFIFNRYSESFAENL